MSMLPIPANQYDGLSAYGILAGQPSAMGMPTYSDPMSMSAMGIGGMDMGAGAGAAGAGAGAAAMGPMGIASAGLSALSSLGQLWMGMKAMKLAKKQFKFTKDVTNTNLANQIQSYNTALADRARSRGVMEGQTPDQVSSYISANSLNRNSGKTGPTAIGTISGAAMSNYSNYVRPGSSSAGSVARTDNDDDTNG